MTIRVGVKVFASLISGPKSQLEIRKISGDKTGSDRYARELHKQGCIYIMSYKDEMPVFAIQPSVGFFPDVDGPGLRRLRTKHFVVLKGESISLMEACKRTGVKYNTAYSLIGRKKEAQAAFDLLLKDKENEDKPLFTKGTLAKKAEESVRSAMLEVPNSVFAVAEKLQNTPT